MLGRSRSQVRPVDGVELGQGAEEVGLLDRHLVEQPLDHGAAALAVRCRPQELLGRDAHPRQRATQSVVLARAQADAAFAPDQGCDIGEPVAHRRLTARTPARSAAMSSVASTYSAPARRAAAGMPSTTALASSWVIVSPPVAPRRSATPSSRS